MTNKKAEALNHAVKTQLLGDLKKTTIDTLNRLDYYLMDEYGAPCDADYIKNYIFADLKKCIDTYESIINSYAESAEKKETIQAPF